MKINAKIKALILGSVCLLPATSCSDFLDKEPDTELSMDLVFDNKEKVESALAYVYSGLPDPGGAWINTLGWDVFSDDMVFNGLIRNFGDWNFIQRVYGTWTPSTTWKGNFWGDYPKRIREAYLFCERVHALPESDLPQSEVDLMKAECRFLAAYYWWHMTETYGPVPFKLNYIAPQNASLADLSTPRTPFDEIVSTLDNELLELSKLIPAKYDNPEKYGRVTSIMVLSTRARMLLFAASPLVNGNSWYEGYENPDGTPLFNSTYDQQKWVKAAEACKLVVEEAEKAGHALYTVYNEDGTVDPFLSTQNVYFKLPSAGNNEITFPYSNTARLAWNYIDYESLATTPEFGGGGSLGVYQGLVDAFFTANGLPIDDANSGYVEDGFSTSVEKRKTSWNEGTGNAGEVTNSKIYNMYCNREPRFYTTVSYHGSWFVLAKRRYNFLKNAADNSYGWNAPANGYLIRRRVYPTANPKGGVKYTNRPHWLYRLSNNYLDYAEAVNEAYDNSASRLEALKYLNKVRVRAGVREYTTATVDLNDAQYIHVDDNQEAIRKLVRMERRVEFVSEGIRYSDIRRWKIVESLSEVNGPCMGMDWAGENETAFFKRTPVSSQTRVWKRAYYWFPIYITEIEKNPNLIQSPFWE